MFSSKTAIIRVILLAVFLLLFSRHLFAQELLQLQGSLNFIDRTLEVKAKPESGDFELNVKLDPASNFSLNIKLKHIKLGMLDILADVSAFGRIYLGEDKIIKRLKFDLSAINLLINHKPVEDILMSCEINDKVLQINSFEGINIFLIGYLCLRRPYDLDILARIKPFSLLDFSAIFDKNNPSLIGDLEGIVRLNGTLYFPQLEANLVVYKGKIEDVPFKEAVINFAGAYPIVRFANSEILGEDDDLLDLKGFLDLSKLYNLESPFHNFKLSPTGNKVRLADWNLMKENIAGREFSFKKEVDENLSVGFESYLKDETKYRDYNKDAFELKYELDAGGYVNMKLKEDEGTLGLGKRLEF